MQIHAYTDAYWPSVWPTFREVVAAGETLPYDPEWTSEHARDVWVVAPGSHGRGPGRQARAGYRAHGTQPSGAGVPRRDGELHGRHRRAGLGGIGRALGEYALSWARQKGYAAMQFNAVVESNHAAVRLWKALGFRVVGTVPEAFKHPTLGRVGLHVTHRFL